MKYLPYFCRGEVVRGFGRGSKELGIPTANFSEQVVESFPSDISTGIYYGWACVGNGDVHKMVLSIGWNPYYKNVKKSVNLHSVPKCVRSKSIPKICFSNNTRFLQNSRNHFKDGNNLKLDGSLLH